MLEKCHRKIKVATPPHETRGRERERERVRAGAGPRAAGGASSGQGPMTSEGADEHGGECVESAANKAEIF